MPLPLVIGFQELLVFIAPGHVTTGFRGMFLLEFCQYSKGFVGLGPGIRNKVVLVGLVVPYSVIPGAGVHIDVGFGK